MIEKIERPKGVTAIAALQFLGGAAMFVVMVAGRRITLFEAAGLALGALAVALAHGMWQLRSWAWLSTTAIHVLIAIMAAVDFLANGTAAAAVPLLISAVVVAYLQAPHIREAFR